MTDETVPEEDEVGTNGAGEQAPEAAAETVGGDAGAGGSLEKVFGIDLGTTYSAIAQFDPQTQRPEVIRDKDGHATTPSVVLFDSRDGSTVVGRYAKEEAVLNAENVAQLFKRQMGEADWRFSIVDDSWQGDSEWSAPALSSLVLRQLCTAVEEVEGTKVENVAITVPAYFGEQEREATRQAGELAGLNVVDVINEPLAAAMSYGLGVEGGAGENVLVYDLGGGTFDITVISITDSEFVEVAKDGNPKLGGADWDAAVQEYVGEKFEEMNPDAGNPQDDPDSAQDLANSCEEAKRALTERESKAIPVTHGGARESIELTRQQFEALTSPLLEETMTLTRKVVESASGKGVELNKIILVGGSSKMPMVKAALESEFSVPVELGDPDLAVAKGAAWHGQRTNVVAWVGEQGSGDSPADLPYIPKEVLDGAGLDPDSAKGLLNAPSVQRTCSQGFGVAYVADPETERLEVEFMVHRDDPLPVTASQTFRTRFENQTSVDVTLYEQNSPEESREPASNTELKTAVITGIPTGYPAGSPIEITMSMNENGMITGEAIHVESGQSCTIEWDASAALSQAEMTQQKKAVEGLQLRD